MPAVRKLASTETAVQFVSGRGRDLVLRADPRALPAHKSSVAGGERGSQGTGTAGGTTKTAVLVQHALSEGAPPRARRDSAHARHDANRVATRDRRPVEQPTAHAGLGVA